MFSERVVHEPLVDEDTFLLVQGMRAARPAKDGTVHRYALTGLLVCQMCRRRMEPHWVHERPAYRCRHGYSSANPRPPDGPRIVNAREDRVLAELPALLRAAAMQGRRVPSVGEVVERLRAARLEIVYGPDVRELRAVTPDRAGPRSRFRAAEQTSLALTWSDPGDEPGMENPTGWHVDRIEAVERESQLWPASHERFAQDTPLLAVNPLVSG